MPNSEEIQPMMSIEPGRRRLIVERLQSSFYEQPDPSQRIAIAVDAALLEPGNGSSLPH